MSEDLEAVCRPWTDRQLKYAAVDRCRCGAGLAHPLDTRQALRLRAWVCARVLRGEVGVLAEEHDSLDFAFYKVREETSINNAEGGTTRPPGTIARTVGKATCPQCQHTWSSDPYCANGLGHHWYSGPCPVCGYAVGGAGVWSSNEGPPIDKRYRTVVLVEEPRA